LYSDPTCPLCPENDKVDIIAMTEDAYLVEAKVSPMEDCFLIIPKQHITDVMELPALWQKSFSAMLTCVPWYTPDAPFTLGLNSGKAAGQTLPHIHNWVIPRREREGSNTYGKGTATLIKELGQMTVVVV